MARILTVWTERNVNDAEHVFLLARVSKKNLSSCDYCLGDARKDRYSEHPDKWTMVVEAPYDEETDSDATLLGYADTAEDAERALLEWANGRDYTMRG